jgi:DNA-binding IclR family transcriptional regulator
MERVLNMGRTAKKLDPAPALTRGLQILRRLNVDGPSTLGQLARTHGWPKSSTARLLVALERAGAIVREPLDGRFRAAMALVPLAAAEDALRAWSGAPLVRLCQACGHTVELYACRDGRLTMVDRSDPEEAEVRVWARIGWEPDPTELTALTQLRLVFGGEASRSTKRKTLWAWRDGKRRPVRGRQLKSLLDRVRRERFATCLDRNPHGVVRYAIPVFGPRDDLQGIVSIAAAPARSDAKTKERLKTLLREPGFVNDTTPGQAR